MARIIHSNNNDVVDAIWSNAKEKGIMHINSQEKEFDGTSFNIKGRELKNFGTCGYLGLEKHPKLMEGAIEMVKKYGTQLSMSRVFIRPKYIQELEEIIGQIFNGNKAICFTSTSTAHVSVIGTIIKPDDLIILDQQVHYSVQYPCKNCKLQGTEVQMVRHSRYDELDKLISEQANKFNRVWYMADGVYSMYGDLPDTDELAKLMKKHPKLHLYFDDAHGMGWSGKNGAGYVFDRMGVSDRIILISTLAKGFGCVGGTAIFADPEMYRQVDIYGGTLTYTHPLSPANVGAAIASAKIHLSDEIYQYQSELRGLMDHMNYHLGEKNLTNISSLDSPIYFIGGGKVKVTTNLVNRILNEGLYVNTATFPVVPNDRSGLRFTLTRHNNKSDIEELADALAYHLPLAIEEEGESISKVYKRFKLEYSKDESYDEKITDKTSLIIEDYDTIQKVDSELWDRCMKGRGNVTHSGMKCMEEIFSNNKEPENNWSFHYPIIKDKQGNVICTTFFTGCISKDDMVSLANVSKKIEEKRKFEPYYLCSKTLMMGSMFTEGNFLYIDQQHPNWEEAISLLLGFVERIKKQIEAKVVVFRDFEEDYLLNSVLQEEGYAKVRMPNSNVIKDHNWKTNEELMAITVSKKKRTAIKKYAIKKEHLFSVSVYDQVSELKAKQLFSLFEQIKDTNYDFNFFKYPEKTTEVLSNYDDWEFIEICLEGKETPIACAWSFKGEGFYTPLIVGLDYEYLESHDIYKQIVYQIVKRANVLSLNVIYCGLSADFEKQKYGAVSIPKFAFAKYDDTYNLELIESFSNV